MYEEEELPQDYPEFQNFSQDIAEEVIEPYSPTPQKRIYFVRLTNNETGDSDYYPVRAEFFIEDYENIIRYAGSFEVIEIRIGDHIQKDHDQNHSFKLDSFAGEGFFSYSFIDAEKKQLLKIYKFDGTKSTDRALREIDNYQELEDQGKIFPHFDTFFLYKNHYCIVLDYLGINLQDYAIQIRKGSAMELFFVQQLIRDVLIQLKHLWDQGKVHSNINWSTITIEKDGENDRYRIKYDSDSLIDMNSRPGPNHNTYYMSPEQVFDQNLTEKSDIWSLAVAAIEYYLGPNHMGRQHFLPNPEDRYYNIDLQSLLGTFQGTPFAQYLPDMEILDNDNDGNQGNFRSFYDEKRLLFSTLSDDPIFQYYYLSENSEIDYSNDLADLLLHMMELDPEKRYNYDQIMKHPFMNLRLDQLEQIPSGQ